MNSQIGRICKQCGNHFMVSTEYPSPPTKCGPCLGDFATAETDHWYDFWAPESEAGFSESTIQRGNTERAIDYCLYCNTKLDYDFGRPRKFCTQESCQRQATAERDRLKYMRKKARKKRLAQQQKPL